MDIIINKEEKLDFSTRDEEIIDKILSGNKNAYEVIMRRYNQRLFRIGHAYFKNEEEIEDVIQTTYVKAYEQLPRFENRAKFSTWLIRIFINESLLRLKLQKRYSSFSDEEEFFDGVFYSNSKSNAMDNPFNIAINNELKDILESAVNDLPEKYRVIFIMREIEDMSTAEASKCLNISESNVKVRLNRAKEMLRDSLSTFYHNNEVFNFDLKMCNRVVSNVLNKISIYKRDLQNE